jgi:23S rRNA (pseudouridine1915-N3)-methyltransferase
LERITIACVGKIKEKYLRDAVAEYAKRLGRYCRLEFREAADEPTREGASAREEETVKRTEGERLLAAIPPDAYVIALDLGGEMLDSVEFAQKIQALASSGRSRIVFVIGGSLGLSEAVLSRADYRLCFSPMTFPHQLMRVILSEQIYRAFRILRNEPYHK